MNTSIIADEDATAEIVTSTDAEEEEDLEFTHFEQLMLDRRDYYESIYPIY